MTRPVQHEIAQRLTNLIAIAPDMRVGQLLSHLGFLCDDMFDQNLAEVDDGQLLQVLRRHEAELERRNSQVA